MQHAPPQPQALDNDVEHFSFIEEGLGFPASEGYGFYQGRVGDTIGHGVYRLEAKLGYGMSSNVWLARDLRMNRHVCIKALKGAETRYNRQGYLNELEILMCMSFAPKHSPKTREDACNLRELPPLQRSNHCITLLGDFHEPGVDVEDGEHLCLVTELMGGTLDTVRDSSPDQFMPIDTVKRILRHVLLALVDVHARGIAHTDLTPGNVMFDLGNAWDTLSIDSWLKDSPPRTYPPQMSLNKMVEVYVSQNLPQPSIEQLGSHTFKLGDFGTAQFVADITTSNITPVGYRAPEIILGAKWNESVDVWSYGCLVYNLLTNAFLFTPITDQGAPSEQIALHQMVCFIDDAFTPDLLQRCTRRSRYFESDGTYKYPRDGTVGKTLEQRIREERSELTSGDIDGAASLMRQCLRFDARNRATAEDLLKNSWLFS